MLGGKSITLGVTGGIAAYKAADLASKLTKLNARVNVIMTRSATNFVTPLTFEAVTGNPVHCDTFERSPGYRVPHIELAYNADIMAVVPATANFLGKMAHGIADDLLTTSVLAARCPILICPAMNVHMYANPVVQSNTEILKKHGYYILEPESGRMACGHQGKGRLPEVQAIINRIIELIPPVGDLGGLTVLITAGGTREPIDPVRYISNRSSGKMGYSLAGAAFNRGARVILITTPTSLEPPPGVDVVRVETALEMHDAVMNRYAEADVVIKAAAVADYRPRLKAEQKIKKEGDTLTLELEKNPDILFDLGINKMEGVTLVGFAAETENLIENAREKVRKKNLDLLVANDVTLPGAGFGTDTNIAKLIYPDGSIVSLPLMDKPALANRILDEVIAIRSNHS
ncbi:phosphopantothenoylcysteine decarboxylase [Desulfocucumis palustris]|uniref:Coenzyme A biosynthesis bifunctional protein CoaBC n=1 Tax=Desulfocucumis palustris TaxID=1898651 RepID=A0A2L2X9F2_9FIRM|nr:bifunctional phosphopantothenoylcysteine decarboxylase/phosphopantothenate--cysteine ligase CoaBC [Desulfocucumis palustris]GBF32564.1 phosphopantothenoylcysteine decarboxylase [Desulfocucumis palustris]